MSRAVSGHAARKRRAQKVAYKKRNLEYKASIISITIVLLLVFVFVCIKGISLNKKIDVYQAREQAVKEEIAAEQARKEEIENYKKYTETKGFVEEVAKSKLGLVYEGEIIFKEDN